MSNQMTNFTKAVMDYANGDVPESYGGEFAKLLAVEIGKVVPTTWAIEMWQVYVTTRAVASQKESMDAFGVKFDTWFSEQTLHNNHSTSTKLLRQLLSQGIMYQTSPITGEPMCGNCANVLVPYEGADIKKGTGSCYPCGLCAKHPEFLNAGKYVERNFRG